ncbi:MAG TPA: rhodanese-like domain-containing protein [Candidatus Didemnitutus sp.]|nr:rhodanese-like domain-containing protein [Candidatus Didemnitutus sp.]
MNTTPKMPSAAEAHDYFSEKMSFTTGPVELNRDMEAGNIGAVVDVRAAEDFEEGHIPGAINLPHGTWSMPKGLVRDKVNVLYCYSQVCHLAATAALEFTALGYTVRELEGGFEGWKKYEMPVESGAVTAGSKVERSPSQENL